MNKYVIVSDSCCDLEKELRERYNIDYLPMHFTVDGKDYLADLDWAQVSSREFYDMMRSGKRIFTSQVNEAQYLEAFEKYLSDGYDILSISCSSALSASVKESRLAKEKLQGKYPERKIICIDSLMACYGLGLLCIRASELRAEGKTIEETAEWIEANKLTMHQEATPEKLTYLKQAGRVSAGSAFFGGLLNIKPIIISDAIGQNAAVEKVKGRQVSIERLVTRCLEELIDVPYQRFFISHADHLEDAEKLKTVLLEKLGKDVEVHIGVIGPTVGATVGPGTLGLYYYGKEVNYNKP